MPRFVILRHESPQGVHFDLMLEAGGVLKTWALPQPPQSGEAIECRRLADHRMAYLDYEGPVSGDRGAVARWDRGTYQLEQDTTACWGVVFHGEKVVGRASLREMPGEGKPWRFELGESV